MTEAGSGYNEKYFENYATELDDGSRLFNTRLYGNDGNPITSRNPIPIVSSDSYITKIDEATATITYIGKAVPGSATSASVWQIKRIDTTTLSADILFEDGDTKFDNDWDSRAAGSYS